MAPSDLASSASSLLPAAQPTVIQQLEQLLTDAHRLEASAASPPSSPSSSSDYLHGPTRIENVHDQSSVAVMSILIAICGFAVFFLLADLVRRAHAHNKTSLSNSRPPSAQLFADFFAQLFAHVYGIGGKSKVSTDEEHAEGGHPRRYTILAWMVATVFFSDVNTMMVSPFLPGEAQVCAPATGPAARG